jgi:type II secretory pathway component PulF
MFKRLNIFYAKLILRMQASRRMAIYKKLASLLRNDFNIISALERIRATESDNGAKPNEPTALAMRAWEEGIEGGMSFSDATRGWVPMYETMMLALGDVSKLSAALDNIVRVGAGMGRIRRALLDAALYPLFLFGLTFLIVIGVGIYLVPSLTEAAGANIHWRGAAATLVSVSNFSGEYWPYLLGGMIGLGLIVWWSFPRWTGGLRTVFDNLPPWSLYKLSESVGWMMSLSAMVASGGSIPVAMRLLSNNSSGYLRDVLERTSRYIANGDNLGRALHNAGREFPNKEVIGDLEIYAEMNSFDANLSGIANDYLENSIKRIESVASALNSIGMILVSAAIAWVVFGTFEMQGQITDALTR